MGQCKKILLIYKEVNDRQILVSMLKNLDYEVNVCSSVSESIEDINHCQPDIILLNIDFMDSNGIAFLQSMKKNHDTARVAVILIFENRSVAKISAGLKHGADDFILKPFNQGLIQVKLNIYLKMRDNYRKVDELNNQLTSEKKSIQKERDVLARYFSQDLIDGILSGSIGTKIGGNIQTASIMFCDMRNSTAIAEQIGPAAFMDLINNLFTDLTDIIYGEGGSVNKFIGDGILATFGCPQELENDAVHCANVALKIRKYLQNFNQFRPKYLKDTIQMGMGLSRGKVFSGNVGSVYQIQYTVLGDPVNIASRLESLSKRASVDILIDGGIRDILGKSAVVQKVNLTRVRGKLEQIRIFYLESLS